MVPRLADRGEFDLDRPLYEMLEYPRLAHDERYKRINARIVLSHGTGLPNWGGEKLTLRFDPGTHYGYSGEGFVFLQKTVERVTGRSLDELARREVFEPLGIDALELCLAGAIRRQRGVCQELALAGRSGQSVHAGRGECRSFAPHDGDRLRAVRRRGADRVRDLTGDVEQVPDARARDDPGPSHRTRASESRSGRAAAPSTTAVTTAGGSPRI
jgi:CubicO group peptidase (beta-lactamase class C family)